MGPNDTIGWAPYSVVWTYFRNEKLWKLTVIVQQPMVGMCECVWCAPHSVMSPSFGTAANINQHPHTKMVISDVLRRAVWQRKVTADVVNREKFNFKKYE